VLLTFIRLIPHLHKNTRFVVDIVLSLCESVLAWQCGVEIRRHYRVNIVPCYAAATGLLRCTGWPKITPKCVPIKACFVRVYCETDNIIQGYNRLVYAIVK